METNNDQKYYVTEEMIKQFNTLKLNGSSVKEIAELCSVSKTTVYKYLKNNSILPNLRVCNKCGKKFNLNKVNNKLKNFCSIKCKNTQRYFVTEEMIQKFNTLKLDGANVKEIAELCSVSKTTVYKYLKNNSILPNYAGFGKKVIVNGAVYESLACAARAIGVNCSTISSRIKSDKWPNYDLFENRSVKNLKGKKQVHLTGDKIYNNRLWLSPEMHSTSSLCCWYNLHTLKPTLRSYFTIKDCHNTFMMPIELDDNGLPTKEGNYIINNVLKKLIFNLSQNSNFNFTFKFNGNKYVCAMEVHKPTNIIPFIADLTIVKTDSVTGDTAVRLRLHGDSETCSYSEWVKKISLLYLNLNEYYTFLKGLK